MHHANIQFLYHTDHRGFVLSIHACGGCNDIELLNEYITSSLEAVHVNTKAHDTIVALVRQLLKRTTFNIPCRYVSFYLLGVPRHFRKEDR